METQKHTALRKDASLDLDVTESLKNRNYLKLHNLIRRFTTGLRSQMFGCKSNRLKTSNI
jgi:hypothetical protein